MLCITRDNAYQSEVGWHSIRYSQIQLRTTKRPSTTDRAYLVLRLVPKPQYVHCFIQLSSRTNDHYKCFNLAQTPERC